MRSVQAARFHVVVPAHAVLALILCVLGSPAAPKAAAAPLMRVLRAESPNADLLSNGNFEQAFGAGLPGWHAAPQRFVLAPGQGRGGSQSIRCENQNEGDWTGASQTLTLDRTNVFPLVMRGWSRAENVSGTSDNDYSLYVDIVYQDGTPLWGQTANFRTGTHDWQERELMILPQKPVRTLTIHCLLRRHTGIAWFDDIRVEEIQATGGALLFQGVPVVPLPPSRAGSEAESTSATSDGLEISRQDNRIATLKVDGRDLAANAPSGFMVRDVAANSDFFGFSRGQCPELGLELRTDYRAEADHLVVEGRLKDTRHRDRAVTLVFALPIEAAGWRWGDDIRHSRIIRGREDYQNLVNIRCGATGGMSLYPLAAISGQHEALALALDMAHPAQYRLGYHSGTHQLYIAYDFGLAPETRRFPGAADFRFVLFRFDPHWGFRGAWAKLMRIFPDYFQVRSRDQGLWMPFTDISTVEGWQDFGFKYHEGDNNVAWDDAHDILSFRYTEPMTWWMPMAKASPRSTVEARRERDRLAQSGKGINREMAQLSYAAAMYDETGQPALLFRNEPWCNGAIWSLNPNPGLHSTPPSGVDEQRATPLNAATVHWNDTIRSDLYGPSAKAHLDGEYLDSIEGYVTADLNFRREHFRDTTVPLTFASDTREPALFKGLAVFEFTRWIGQEVHRLGKLTFANGVPYRFTYLCPWLDVLGTETDWVQGGRYQPASDEQMSLWRTLSGAKPYLLLMNTDYDVFNASMVERYFQRSLFYGMFPGMFSHNAAENPYWQNPKWYNRDRPLFKRYLPLIKQTAEAGWQPITGATCDNPQIFLERFGPDSGGRVYLTAFNDTDREQVGQLQLDASVLPQNGASKPVELLSRSVPGDGSSWKVSLGPQQVKVFQVAVGLKSSTPSR